MCDAISRLFWKKDLVKGSKYAIFEGNIALIRTRAVVSSDTFWITKIKGLDLHCKSLIRQIIKMCDATSRLFWKKGLVNSSKYAIFEGNIALIRTRAVVGPDTFWITRIEGLDLHCKSLIRQIIKMCDATSRSFWKKGSCEQLKIRNIWRQYYIDQNSSCSRPRYILNS